MAENNHRSCTLANEARPRSWRRFVPLLVVAVLSLAIVAMGWHRQLSLESLARHHEWLQRYIGAHEVGALAAYVGLYIAAVALSLPVGAYCSMIGGILFGVIRGGVGAVVGATLGAICVFLIARSAFGEHLVRRAGPTAERIAKGFRADAFSYLLFLRLVPVFPFWLVNLVAGAMGIRLSIYVGATFLGMIPGAFVYASLGNGIGALIAAGEHPDRYMIFRPSILLPLIGLAALALVPVIVKRWRGRSHEPAQ